MSLDLLEFPPEINEKIFKYCSKPDLISIARCSKFFYDSVKPFLWKIVRVRWSNIHKAPNSDVFQHTTALQFRLGSQVYKRRYDADPDAPKWTSVAPFYKNILQNCDVDRLNLLTIVSVVNSDGLDLTFKTLTGLENLSICNNSFLAPDSFKSICSLTELKRLTLKDCNVDNSLIGELSKLPKLEDLYIDNSSLDDSSLKLISEIKTLKRLTYVNHDSNPSGDVYKDLYKLNQLQYLNLDCTKCSDSALFYLCKHLKELRCLSLNGCQNVTDRGLEQLSDLLYLKQLHFHSCRHLTSQVFTKFSSLPLQKITFTLSYQITVDVFSTLGAMSALQEITIVNPHRRFSALEIENFCKSSGMCRKDAHMSTAYNILQLVKPKKIQNDYSK